ncbi:MAG: hypothetical protein GXN99_00110 [Candidatus Nanohaloarchaeota archaeon]|nr:hypothetical protein [Candidatus Nanohaloarchaeota archaeon]
MKKTALYAYLTLITLLALSLNVYGLVNKNEDWLPLQQIAILPNSDISIDENYNGIVDNAEALGGRSASEYLLNKGGTLKGYLYLYYGIGKIIDMDNLNYYIDPSSTSRFNILCVNDKCIKSFDELIPPENTELEEKIATLEQWCIDSNCSKGINAQQLQNHVVGYGEGNILIINSSHIYYSLTVGKSINAQYLAGKDPSYFQPLLNEKCESGSVVGFENGTIVCNQSYQPSFSVEEIYEAMNNTAFTLIHQLNISLQAQIKEVEKILHQQIINNITQLSLKYDSQINEIKTNFVKKDDLLQYPTKNEVNNQISNVLSAITSLQNSISSQIDERIKNKFSNAGCNTGLMKGFDSNTNIVCKSYRDIAFEIDNYLNYATDEELNQLKQQILANTNTINDLRNYLVQYIDNTLSTEVKAQLANKRCYNGVSKGFDYNGNLECVDYSTLSSSLVTYLDDSLTTIYDTRYVLASDLSSILNDHNYLSKNELPVCGDKQYLTVKNGILQCQSLPSYSITLGSSDTISDDTYYAEGTFTLECKSGYVMTGIKINRDEEGGLGGKTFIREVEPVCKEISITS